jgi:hypothetical protein
MFCHQANQPLMQRQAQSADALRAKAQGGGQNQVGSIRLEQVCGTNIGPKAFGDDSYHVHQGFGGLAAVLRQIAYFLEGEDVTGVQRISGLTHVSNSPVSPVRLWFRRAGCVLF